MAMEDFKVSWLMRVNDAHTVSHRLEYARSRSESAPPSFPSRNAKVAKEPTTENCDEEISRLGNRVPSPQHTIALSDAFKDARSDVKRFSSPIINGKELEKDGLRKLLPKSVRESSWGRYFDYPGKRRVTVLETLGEMPVDLKKLYLGLPFASGAHSTVYRGVYEDLPVAAKVVSKPNGTDHSMMATRLREEYETEVAILPRLQHRNVIKLVGTFRAPPVYCIITEYLSEGSLRAFLQKPKNQSLPLQKLIVIALDIAQGMEYVHSKGIIHRDLKPENILFDKDLCAKITDFGIACTEAHCNPWTEDFGTYRWMAPEMLNRRSSSKPYGRKVDVYSFGLIMWEMLTGSIPFEGLTSYQAAFAVVDRDLRPTIPANCPPPLQALIEKCWAWCPDKRPEFSQIVSVLKQLESSLAFDNTLSVIQNLDCQDQEQKKQLPCWIRKLKASLSCRSCPPLCIGF